MEKKNLIVNCDLCDARKVDEESLSQYEKITVNADVLVVDRRSKAALNRLPVSCNADSVVESEEDVKLLCVNGVYEIGENHASEGRAVLIVNGKLDIQPDAGQALQRFVRIMVNGMVSCPKSLSGYLDNIQVNGTTELYPDDCVRLRSRFTVDKYFPLRAKEGSTYYAARKVILTDLSVNVQELVKKEVQFVTKYMVVAEELLGQALLLVDESVELDVVPAGYAYVEEDAVLNEELLQKYGTALYVDGDLKLVPDSTELIARVEKLIVKEIVKLTAEQAEEFKKIDAVYGRMKIMKGRTIAERPRVRLDNSLLSQCPQGVTISECALVEVAEEVEPSRILELVKLDSCGVVRCSRQQQSALEMVSENTGKIKTEEEKEASLPLGDVRVINADSYEL